MVVNPKAGKLDPHWDGRWCVKSVKTPRTMEITDGVKTKIVPVNCLRQRIVLTAPIWRDPVGECYRNHTQTGKHLELTIWKCLSAQFYFLYTISIKMWPLQDNAEVHCVQPELHVQVLGEIPQENAPVDQQHTAEERRYPGRIRRPPERY